MAKTCQKCGTINLQNATYCTHCGKNLERPTQENEPQEIHTPIPNATISAQVAKEATEESKTPQNSSTDTPTKSDSLNNQTPPPRPDNQLTKAILVTLFCCLPLGIAAIIESSGVEAAYNSGNYDLAYAKAKNAEILVKYTFWLGLISIGGYIMYIIIMAISTQ